jgi:hypothetical protein
MSKLSDTQTILLSHASQRADGSLYPLPDTLAPGGGRTKALAALVRGGLAEERETSDAGAIHREDGDLRYGLFATAAGFAAIGVEPVPPASTPAEPNLETEQTSPAPPRSTKSAAVLALLQREQGATLAELIQATGWLPHTTRAALTGLRKKGHSITRGKRGDATCYTLAAA